MNKDKFDKLFEDAIENAVEKDRCSAKIKERFIALEVGRDNILKMPELTQTDLILELGKKAAFMHTQPVSTNSLPVTDETILLFLNSEDESVESGEKKSEE